MLYVACTCVRAEPGVRRSCLRGCCLCCKPCLARKQLGVRLAWIKSVRFGPTARCVSGVVNHAHDCAQKQSLKAIPEAGPHCGAELGKRAGSGAWDGNEGLISSEGKITVLGSSLAAGFLPSLPGLGVSMGTPKRSALFLRRSSSSADMGSAAGRPCLLPTAASSFLNLSSRLLTFESSTPVPNLAARAFFFSSACSRRGAQCEMLLDRVEGRLLC
jgi:hypothetical protein